MDLDVEPTIDILGNSNSYEIQTGIKFGINFDAINISSGGHSMLNIDIINHSTVLTDAQVVAAVPAAQAQITNDLGPAWDVTATLYFVPNGTTPNPAHYQMIILDDSDQQGALGYHQLTAAGLPIGYVFAKDTISNGLSWTVTLTHELCEMCVDEYCVYSVTVMDDNGNCTSYMLEVGDACFTGDTKISLLNGTERTIESLIGEESFWVYSCDGKGNIVPGKARAARKTGEQKELIQIILDNGEQIKCTPTHKFLMRDGSYKEASKMVIGESLMPLYRQNKKLNKAIPKSKEYEQVYNPATNNWLFTHRVVEPTCPKDCVRHHKDFNRFNNSPDNLVVMDKQEHMDLHAAHIRHYSKISNDKMIAAGTHPFQQPRSKKERERSSKQMIAYNKSKAHRKIASQMGKENIKFIWNNPEAVEKIKAANSKRCVEMNATQEHKEMLKEVFQTKEFKRAASINARKVNHTRWHQSRGIVKDNCEYCSVVNHKVISIESIKSQDVYDITVEKYHNFALSAGVFVHNCEDDQFGYTINGTLVSDFCLPSWWLPGSKAPYDFKNHTTAPLQLLQGGYIGILKSTTTEGWNQLTAQEHGPTSRSTIPHIGSRRARRAIPLTQRKRSAI